ncbi:hypothetical protein ACFQS6_07245 [Xanthomonas populi]
MVSDLAVDVRADKSFPVSGSSRQEIESYLARHGNHVLEALSAPCWNSRQHTANDELPNCRGRPAVALAQRQYRLVVHRLCAPTTRHRPLHKELQIRRIAVCCYNYALHGHHSQCIGVPKMSALWCPGVPTMVFAPRAGTIFRRRQLPTASDSFRHVSNHPGRHGPARSCVLASGPGPLA